LTPCKECARTAKRSDVSDAAVGGHDLVIVREHIPQAHPDQFRDLSSFGSRSPGHERAQSLQVAFELSRLLASLVSRRMEARE